MKQIGVLIKTVILLIILLVLQILLTLAFHFLYPESNLQIHVQIAIDISILFVFIMGFFSFYKDKIEINKKSLKPNLIIFFLCLIIIWVYVSPIFKYPFLSYSLNLDKLNICIEKIIVPNRNGILELYPFARLILITPILEELLFRKIILVQLRSKYGIYLSVIFTSILFSISHLDLYNFLIFFIGSVILCIIFLKSNNIKYSIVYHILMNLITILLC